MRRLRFVLAIIILAMGMFVVWKVSRMPKRQREFIGEIFMAIVEVAITKAIKTLL